MKINVCLPYKKIFISWLLFRLLFIYWLIYFCYHFFWYWTKAISITTEYNSTNVVIVLIPKILTYFTFLKEKQKGTALWFIKSLVNWKIYLFIYLIDYLSLINFERKIKFQKPVTIFRVSQITANKQFIFLCLRLCFACIIHLADTNTTNNPRKTWGELYFKFQILKHWYWSILEHQNYFKQNFHLQYQVSLWVFRNIYENLAGTRFKLATTLIICLLAFYPNSWL